MNFKAGEFIMNNHVNYQLIDKISKNRRKNRDDIKQLIETKNFYHLHLSIPVIGNLVGNVNYNIVNDYKFYINDGVFEVKPLLLLKYEDIQHSRHIVASDVEGSLRSHLELMVIVGNLSYDKNTPTTIFIEKDAVRVPLTGIFVKNKSNKFRVDYSEFNSIRNYPDHNSYKDQTDVDLSKIIAPYYFTGYKFKIISLVYDKELKYILKHTATTVSLADNNLTDSTSTVNIVLPEKYCSWHFKKDSC